ncbi:MAG: HU family DNA-binding protein [Gammaproteobacteria bacterium]|nr:HU family DNA-binding protein [Gammaproteobacteria bacterium]
MAVKKTAKKPAAKKPAAAAKKTAAKQAVKKAAPAAPKTTPITEKQTKSQILSVIAEETGMARKDVSAVFAVLGNLVQRHMKKRGSGEFSVPEVGVKIRRVRKPATKARKMISPFTGEEITVKAKPAREVVKVSALKSLKDSASK